MTTCAACSDPLVIPLHDSPTETIPDDLLLACGCHFHWQCLIDQSAQVVQSLSCPNCGAYLPSSNAASSSSSLQSEGFVASLLARYANEGGVQEGLDLLPTLAEEAYLAANPSARPARALHIMCAEGDVEGIVELLRVVENGGNEEEDEGEEGATEVDAMGLLRYQDPLNGMRTGLMVAVERGQEEVFWLLLWLASAVSTEAFSEGKAQIAQGVLGLQRGVVVVPGRDDIRFLKDERGRTAADFCADLGGQWQSFVEGGLFD